MIKLFLLALFGVSVLAGPIVNIQGLGQIEGLEFDTSDPNIKAHGFFNVPFAAPPTGNLKFEKPQPIQPWTGVHNGTVWGPGCVPHTQAGIQGPFDHNCLTLNIIKRATFPLATQMANPQGLPVVIYFPAGGFETGTMAIYSKEGYANIWATQDVIVVSAQYRLGPYGFLSTGDDRLPGNLGIWDQVETLKFLKAHIADFGGNPDAITVWGLSSTGCSVGQLTLTPKANTLFARTIEQSGSPFSNWPAGTTVVENSKQYIQAIGCDATATAAVLKACLRSKTETDSMNTVNQIGSATDDFAWLKFGPVVDGDLFTDYPHKLIKDAPPKASLQGAGNKDGGYFTLANVPGGVSNWGININGSLSYWGESDLINAINRLFRTPKLYGNRSDEATYKIIDYYVNQERGEGPRDNAFFLDRYNQLFTDIMWHVPHADRIRLKSLWGWPIYAYSMDHHNDGGFFAYDMPAIPQKARGAYHVSEVFYTMGLPFYGPYDLSTAAEVTVTQTLQQTFINFVKNGVPTPNGNGWPAASAISIGHYSISSTPQYKTGFYDDVWTFWNAMRLDYGFDVITLTPTIQWEVPAGKK